MTPMMPRTRMTKPKLLSFKESPLVFHEAGDDENKSFCQIQGRGVKIALCIASVKSSGLIPGEITPFSL